LVTPGLIASQSITGSRSIDYFVLNEIEKLRIYSINQDSVIVQYERELSLKDSILTLKDRIIDRYEKETLPAYKEIVSNNAQTIEAQESIIRYKDAQISIQKNKKWTWGVVGVLLGSIISLLAF
jgi:hypothetical protein